MKPDKGSRRRTDAPSADLQVVVRGAAAKSQAGERGTDRNRPREYSGKRDSGYHVRVAQSGDATRKATVGELHRLRLAGATVEVMSGPDAGVCLEIGATGLLVGAGPDCDGQVLVVNDMLGMPCDYVPKFVKSYANLGKTISKATTQYCDEVKSGKFPDKSHSFK